jgi:hypothetical protein
LAVSAKPISLSLGGSRRSGKTENSTHDIQRFIETIAVCLRPADHKSSGRKPKGVLEVSLEFGRLLHKSAEVSGDTFGDTFSVAAVAFKAGSGQVSERCRIASPMRLFRRRTPFRRIFGDTSGDTLLLYPVPRLAALCESIRPFKSMICKGLCGQYAPACTPLQLWKKLTQNPPRATSWGFDPPSRHQPK